MIKVFGNLFLLASIFLFACQSGTKEPEKTERQKLYEEVMAIHDEMMPKIKPMRDVQKEILAALNDTSQNLSEEQKANYGAAYTFLENADKHMNNWMKQFKNPPQDGNDTYAIKYLTDQKKKVTIMKTMMEQNITEAKKAYKFEL